MPLTRVVVINDHSAAQGGTAALALLSVRQLRARGIPVSYVCGDCGSNPELADLGVEVVAANEPALLEQPAFEAARKGILNTATRRMLADFIADRDDAGTVYHLHGWAQILSPSIFSALGKVAPRSFVHAHDMFLACPNGVYMDYRKGEVCTRRPLSLDCIATHCDKRAYHHKLWRIARQAALRRTFDTSLNWGGVFQIHPDMQPRLERGGIPSRLCRTLRNPAAPFSETRIPAEDNTGFLYVGRLESDKGVLKLAQAARRAGVDVTFVGDGAGRGRIEAEFPEFPVTGWKSRDEIGEIAKRARALVMPSLHPEPFSLVLPEAVHAGLPVLVAQTALVAREIEQNGLGFAFDASDDASFDAALNRIKTAPRDTIRDMSVHGFSGALRLALTPDAWGDALLEAYQGVVERRQRPR